MASADTVQYGGFGTAYIGTSVYVKRATDPHPPTRVLAFSCEGPAPRPYVLDEANIGGTIGLTMNWSTAKRLQVTYNGHATLDLEVNKIDGVEVSVRDLSKKTFGDFGAALF